TWSAYDLLFVISNYSSAGTPAFKPCALSARSTPTTSQPLEDGIRGRPAIDLPSLPQRPLSHSNRIARKHQTAHFKSLYRKRSGRGVPRATESDSAGAFPIQP